jgi:hypothetical protein
VSNADSETDVNEGQVQSEQKAQKHALARVDFYVGDSMTMPVCEKSVCNLSSAHKLTRIGGSQSGLGKIASVTVWPGRKLSNDEITREWEARRRFFDGVRSFDFLVLKSIRNLLITTADERFCKFWHRVMIHKFDETGSKLPASDDPTLSAKRATLSDLLLSGAAGALRHCTGARGMMDVVSGLLQHPKFSTSSTPAEIEWMGLELFERLQVPVENPQFDDLLPAECIHGLPTDTQCYLFRHSLKLVRSVQDTVKSIKLTGELETTLQLQAQRCMEKNPNLTEEGCTCGIHFLHRFEHLTTLHVANCGAITDDVIAKLYSHELTDINFSGCVNVTDTGVEQLGALVKCDLSWTAVTDVGAQSLAEKCRETLTHCSLSGCKITDSGIYCISLLAKKLVHIDLSFTLITDSGVVDIAKHCNFVESLNLRNTIVTDGALFVDDSYWKAGFKCIVTDVEHGVTEEFEFNLTPDYYGLQLFAAEVEARLNFGLKSLNTRDNFKDGCAIRAQVRYTNEPSQFIFLFSSNTSACFELSLSSNIAINDQNCARLSKGDTLSYRTDQGNEPAVIISCDLEASTFDLRISPDGPEIKGVPSTSWHVRSGLRTGDWKTTFTLLEQVVVVSNSASTADSGLGKVHELQPCDLIGEQGTAQEFVIRISKGKKVICTREKDKAEALAVKGSLSALGSLVADSHPVIIAKLKEEGDDAAHRIFSTSWDLQRQAESLRAWSRKRALRGKLTTIGGNTYQLGSCTPLAVHMHGCEKWPCANGSYEFIRSGLFRRLVPSIKNLQTTRKAMYLYVSRSSAQVSQPDEFMQSKPEYNDKRYEETAPVNSGKQSILWVVAEAEEIWDDKLGWQGAASPICRLKLLPEEDAFGAVPIGSQACRLKLLGKDTNNSSDDVPRYWQSRTRVNERKHQGPRFLNCGTPVSAGQQHIFLIAGAKNAESSAVVFFYRSRGDSSWSNWATPAEWDGAHDPGLWKSGAWSAPGNTVYEIRATVDDVELITELPETVADADAAQEESAGGATPKYGANSTDPAEWSQWEDERDMLVSSGPEHEQQTLGIVPLPLVSGLNDAALQRSPVDRAISRFVKARVPTMMHEVVNLRIHAEESEVQGWSDEIQRHSNTLNAVLFKGLVAAWEAAMSASIAAQAALAATEARRKRGVSGDSSNKGFHVIDVRPPRGLLRLIGTCTKLKKLDLTDCRLVTAAAIKQLEGSGLEVTRIQGAVKLNVARFLRFIEGDLRHEADGRWGEFRRKARQANTDGEFDANTDGEFEADRLKILCGK